MVKERDENSFLTAIKEKTIFELTQRNDTDFITRKFDKIKKYKRSTYQKETELAKQAENHVNFFTTSNYIVPEVNNLRNMVHLTCTASSATSTTAPGIYTGLSLQSNMIESSDFGNSSKQYFQYLDTQEKIYVQNKDELIRDRLVINTFPNNEIILALDYLQKHLNYFEQPDDNKDLQYLTERSVLEIHLFKPNRIEQQIKEEPSLAFHLLNVFENIYESNKNNLSQLQFAAWGLYMKNRCRQILKEIDGKNPQLFNAQQREQLGINPTEEVKLFKEEFEKLKALIKSASQNYKIQAEVINIYECGFYYLDEDILQHDELRSEIASLRILHQFFLNQAIGIQKEQVNNYTPPQFKYLNAIFSLITKEALQDKNVNKNIFSNIFSLLFPVENNIQEIESVTVNNNTVTAETTDHHSLSFDILSGSCFLDGKKIGDTPPWLLENSNFTKIIGPGTIQNCRSEWLFPYQVATLSINDERGNYEIVAVQNLDNDICIYKQIEIEGKLVWHRYLEQSFEISPTQLINEQIQKTIGKNYQAWLEMPNGLPHEHDHSDQMRKIAITTNNFEENAITHYLHYTTDNSTDLLTLKGCEDIVNNRYLVIPSEEAPTESFQNFILFDESCQFWSHSSDVKDIDEISYDSLGLHFNVKHTSRSSIPSRIYSRENPEFYLIKSSESLKEDLGDHFLMERNPGGEKKAVFRLYDGTVATVTVEDVKGTLTLKPSSPAEAIFAMKVLLKNKNANPKQWQQIIDFLDKNTFSHFSTADEKALAEIFNELINAENTFSNIIVLKLALIAQENDIRYFLTQGKESTLLTSEMIEKLKNSYISYLKSLKTLRKGNLFSTEQEKDIVRLIFKNKKNKEDIENEKINENKMIESEDKTEDKEKEGFIKKIISKKIGKVIEQVDNFSKQIKQLQQEEETEAIFTTRIKELFGQPALDPYLSALALEPPFEIKKIEPFLHLFPDNIEEITLTFDFKNTKILSNDDFNKHIVALYYIARHGNKQDKKHLKSLLKASSLHNYNSLLVDIIRHPLKFPSVKSIISINHQKSSREELEGIFELLETKKRQLEGEELDLRKTQSIRKTTRRTASTTSKRKTRQTIANKPTEIRRNTNFNQSHRN